MSFLSPVTVLGMEDTQRGQTSLPSWRSQSGGDTDSKRAIYDGGSPRGLLESRVDTARLGGFKEGILEEELPDLGF